MDATTQIIIIAAASAAGAATLITALIAWAIAAARGRRLRAQIAQQTERATQAETALAEATASIATLTERAERAEASLAEAQQSIATLTERASASAERADKAETTLSEAQQSITAHAERAARAEAALEREQAALAESQRNEQRMADTFARLSGEALRASADQLIQRADEQFRSHQQLAHSDLSALIAPMRQQLDQQAQSIQALEASRQQAYGSIEAQIRQMSEGQQSLTAATQGLTTALRRPGVRGRWGEIQLRQVVEAAGMSNLCDFSEQQTITTDEGRQQRPDMVIKLPNGRAVIVDAKVPLDAYLSALDEPDEAKRPALLAQHAAQVRAHVDAMGSRDYQRSLDGAHDFVVLFIPGEVFYSAALEHDSTLLEHAMRKSVILANPATLIGLLKAVATGWREAQLSDEAHAIKTEGESIYKALKTVAEHMGKVGKGLQKSVEAYNSAIGSLEGRLLPSARRMQSLKISDEQIATPALIEQHPRPITRAELLPTPDADEEEGQALTA